MGAGGLQYGQVVIGGPLEQSAQIAAVGLQGPAPVAGQERHYGQLVFVESERRLSLADDPAG
jgi:hypothetical protein